MDCKRRWLTWWITKVLVIALNFFPAFISNSKYAMHLGIWRCTHHQTQVHFLRRLSLPQRNFAPLSRVAKWEAHFMRMCVCAFWHHYVLKLVIIFRSTEAAIIPKYIIARNYQHKHCQQGLLMSNPCTDKSCSTAGDRTLEAVSIKKLEQHVNQQGKQHQAQGNKVPCMTVMNCNHTWLLVCFVHVIITSNLHELGIIIVLL